MLPPPCGLCRFWGFPLGSPLFCSCRRATESAPFLQRAGFNPLEAWRLFGKLRKIQSVTRGRLEAPLTAQCVNGAAEGFVLGLCRSRQQPLTAVAKRPGF